MEEKDLLRIGSTGKTILQEMLLSGKKPECENYDNKVSLDIILKTKRYDLLPYVTIKNLLRHKTLNETYIDYILEMFKKNKQSINISLFDPFDKNASVNEIASLYMKYAKEDLLEYLPSLTKDNLLLTDKKERLIFKNKRLIEVLLNKDKELTMEKILSKSNIQDFDIAVILNMNDITQELVSLDFISKKLSEKYIEQYNKRYKDMYHKLDPRTQQLINKLYSVFSDCENDAVETMIYSYIDQLKNNTNEYAINEIQQLINIKQNTNFKLKKDEESYFYTTENTLCLSDKITSVFNHEIGHALLHNLVDRDVDDRFFDILDKSYKNPNFLGNVASFSKEYYDLLKKISKITSEEYYEEYYDIKSDEKVDEIQKYLDKQANIKVSEYTNKGFSKDTLDVILNNSFTIEEFMDQHKKIQRSELKQSIMRTQADVFLAVADIIDATSKGAFSTGKLKTPDGKRIKPCAGHGIFYYNVEKSLVFDEIMANYSLITKSPYKEEGLYWLRKCVGNELLMFISSYYNNIMLASNNLTYLNGENHDLRK